jgi:hypothetical protein
VLDQMRELCERIKREHPGASPSLTTFDSGAANLHATIGSEIYVMEYLPSLAAVGVSKVSAATYGWEGFDHPFKNFTDAEAFMLDLLRNQPGQ